MYDMNLKSWDWKNVVNKERDFWLVTPAKEVFAFAHELKQKGLKKVYDLGCGIGRNLYFLIEQGFEVYGSDFSEHAVYEINQKLKSVNYPYKIKCESMTDIHEDNASFDAVIAFHVICHGYKKDTLKAVQEIKRILKPGGMVLITFLSTRGVQGEFRDPQVEDWTIIKQDGVEAGIPHHFSDRDEIINFMDGFEIYDLTHVEHEYDRLQKRSCHYYVKAIKL